jgi:hypothetical protein
MRAIFTRDNSFDSFLNNVAQVSDMPVEDWRVFDDGVPEILHKGKIAITASLCQQFVVV